MKHFTQRNGNEKERTTLKVVKKPKLHAGEDSIFLIRLFARACQIGTVGKKSLTAM